jgi:predicted transposase YbfD/YdcC
VRERRPVLALDGKTVRGAHIRTDTDTDTDTGAGYRQPHLVSVLDQASGAVLGQVAVEEKGSEVGAFTTLLDNLDLTDVLITADAVHTNRNHADYLHDHGGHYLLTVKSNQPTLLRRLRALPWSQIGVAAREHGRGHGRVETRSISVVSLDPCPDAGGQFFPHAAQAIKLVRRRRALASKKWTTVTVYAITSLTAYQADPVLLARWLRGHWCIEALHWVRDVSFDEDRSQVRTGHGPQSWPPCATWSSPHYDWPGPPTSPPRSATTPVTRNARSPPTRSHDDFASALASYPTPRRRCSRISPISSWWSRPWPMGSGSSCTASSSSTRPAPRPI